MSTASDGGPAFPSPAINNDSRIDWAVEYGYGGMTLRDWFAGQALSGVLAQPEQTGNTATAKWCYTMADAMLEAREAKP